MRFISFDVYHFGCVKRATVKLGPGLNILYGPNDLGKSTLAHAVRAALLVQTSSKAVSEHIPWLADEDPRVRVVFETESQRIWRVDKTFVASRGKAELFESRDGVSFTATAVGREVDERVRSLLGWGIGAPGGRGAPRGIPEAFLATVLLGQQGDVTGVLEKTLGEDTAESGKERLIAALQAFAQDPVYKQILEDAQKQVDQAFTATGRRKKGRTSPFYQALETVKEARTLTNVLIEQAKSAEQAQREFDARRVDRDEAATELERTKASLAELQKMAALAAQRKKVEEQLETALAKQTRQARLFEAVDQTSAAIEALDGKRKQAAERLQAATLEHAALADAAKAAEEALRRARSEESARERELAKSRLGQRISELKAAFEAAQSKLETAKKAVDKQAELDTLEADCRKAADEQQRCKQRIEQLDKEQQTLAQRIHELEGAETLLQRRELTRRISDLDEAAAEAKEEQAKAAALEEQAAQLKGAIPKDLPSDEALATVRELKRALELAKARLGGGLSVQIETRADVDISVARDDAPAEIADNEPIEAQRSIVLELPDVARIKIQAGEADARRNVAQLEEQWASDGQPLLETWQVADVEALATLCREAVDKQRRATDLHKEAKTLREQAELRCKHEGERKPLQEKVAVLHAAMAAFESLEEVQARADALQSTAAVANALQNARRAQSELREKKDVAQKKAQAAQLDHSGLQTRVDLVRQALDGLAASKPEAGWNVAVEQLSQSMAALQKKRAGVERELAEIDAEEGRVVSEAEQAKAGADSALSEAEKERDRTRELLQKLEADKSGLEGKLGVEKAQCEGLDPQKMADEIAVIRKRLQSVPEPERALSEQDLSTAETQVEDAKRKLEAFETELRKAEGAFESSGGTIIEQKVEDAQQMLEQAQKRQRDVEVDFDAYQLLVDTLREAENTEGQHLGRALAEPIGERLAAITHDRYEQLSLGPELGSQGIVIDGVTRDLERLSVGTNEQIATLLRLTIAEHLESAIILDDQLTQTDAQRGEHFRKLLRDQGAKSQIIVITCQPLSYVDKSEMPKNGDAMVERAAGLVRVIDLEQVIDRA
jgi:DNA repair exonuclease SbcCD ATPase subunit